MIETADFLLFSLVRLLNHVVKNDHLRIPVIKQMPAE